jgi:hypothetical protein
MGKPFTQEDVERWATMIGQKVWKNPPSATKEPKPFKSGRKVNTVLGLVTHEQTGGWGFTFEEDESVVECFRCSLAPEDRLDDKVSGRGTWTRYDREVKDFLDFPIFAEPKVNDGFQPTHQFEGIILKDFK